MTADLTAEGVDDGHHVCPECGLFWCVCFDDDDQPDEDDGMDDCHMGPDGYCGAAGSEYCDWECPLHNSYFGQAILRAEGER